MKQSLDPKMTTIDLPPELMTSLKQLANQRGSSVEGIVEVALTDYLREQRHQRLLQEMERFRTQHQQLREEYAGEFIGMYDGRVLDHDPDGSTLYNRLRRQHGNLPILIVKVGDTAEQEFRRLHRRLIS